jgi:putative transposase
MYDYRKWNPEQRADAIEERIAKRYPLHSPPHVLEPSTYRIISATCFEHKPIFDDPERLNGLEGKLLDHLAQQSLEVAAWVVLPNHYHVLLWVPEVDAVVKSLGQFHGRTSYEINKLDNNRGRQVWYRCFDRVIRSERHYFATLNYIHNNPVKHGYVDRWGDWPFSSFHLFLETRGRDWLVEMWREYPILDYGAKWDV